MLCASIVYAMCCVVLRGAAWCCAVLRTRRGDACLHMVLYVYCGA